MSKMTNDSGKLKIISGNRSGEEFIVRDGMVIGRDRSCDIFIDDNAASRRHCKINIKDEGVEIIDLESRNGTKLNDKLISRAI
ncbi:MAG: FHA domain-containing protein, partial [candidate division WOR-3 bacterium]